MIDGEVFVLVPAHADIGDLFVGLETSLERWGVHHQVHVFAPVSPESFDHAWGRQGVECSVRRVGLGDLVVETGLQVIERGDMHLELRTEEKLVGNGHQDIGLTAFAVPHHEDFLPLRHDERYERGGSSGKREEISSADI